MQSFVEYAVYWFQLEVRNHGQHTQLSQQNEAALMHMKMDFALPVSFTKFPNFPLIFLVNFQIP